MRPIDAESLWKAISNVGFPALNRNGYIDRQCVYELIKKAPTVERQKGKWEFDSWGNYCSKCGYRQVTTGKFCSECGADMREADNG